MFPPQASSDSLRPLEKGRIGIALAWISVQVKKCVEEFAWVDIPEHVQLVQYRRHIGTGTPFKEDWENCVRWRHLHFL